MAEEEKRLIIAKGLSGFFDMLETIGDSETDIYRYTGDRQTARDIIALKHWLADPNDDDWIGGWDSPEHILSVLWNE